MSTKSTDETQSQYACWCGASGRARAVFWGSILVLLGGLGLLGAFVPLHNLAQYLLPAFLILWGGFILVSWFSRR